MSKSLNIVELIETNPITRLSNTYQNKLLTKIKERFTDDEQQIFVASFYCYLNYHDEFIIDLSFDLRLTSGKVVSQFLGYLKFRLEARFNKGLKESNESLPDIQCVKCYRDLTEDIDGNIFFQKVINSKYNGYICSNCLNGW